jgi:putative membrane protein
MMARAPEACEDASRLVPERLALPLVALHVTANLVWIGSILAVAWLCGRARLVADGTEVGRYARAIYLRFAVPGFLVAVGAGIARLLVQPAAYLHAHWMHGKLLLAVVLIGLHHVVGAKAKRISRADTDAETGTGVLVLGILVAAAGAVVLVVMREALVR